MDHRRKKLIVNSVLNFRSVTHFWLCMLEKQVSVVHAFCPNFIGYLKPGWAAALMFPVVGGVVVVFTGWLQGVWLLPGVVVVLFRLCASNSFETDLIWVFNAS